MCKRLQFVQGLYVSLFVLSVFFISCGGDSSSSGGTSASASESASASASIDPFASASTSLIISSSNAVSATGVGKNGLISYYPTTGYTGTSTTSGVTYTVLQGLANQPTTAPVNPAYIDYSVNASVAGSYTFKLTYSFGGTETNLRDCYIIVNGVKVLVDTDTILELPYTGVSDGKWNTFVTTAAIPITLVAGENDIRLTAVCNSSYTRTITYTRSGTGITAGVTTFPATVTGLPNVASITISGSNSLIAGTGSIAFYSLTTGVADSGTGSITYLPNQDFYLPGTQVTLVALPASGYTFDSWMGDAPSTASSYVITMNSNTSLTARFVKTGAAQPSDLTGYGAVQDDSATKYTLTGGYGGTAVTVSTLADLRTYLTSTSPYIVTIDGEITSGSDTVSTSITVASNKTIYGSLTNQGKLKNIELKLNGENYIVRNLVSHEVICYDGYAGIGNDNITINGGKHIWIDHCEFYSQLKPAACPDFASANDGPADGIVDQYDYKDYYDGQIDISDKGRWITISNNYFHDHWKSLLWGDSETDTDDAAIRVTLHHNYFKNILSRMPMLRYGKAHVYNNYFDAITSLLINGVEFGSTANGVDARCGGTLLVEGNYYLNYKQPIFSSDGTGLVNASDNLFTTCVNGNTAPASTWKPGYSYSSTLQSASTISSGTPTSWAGVGILTTLP